MRLGHIKIVRHWLRPKVMFNCPVVLARQRQLVHTFFVAELVVDTQQARVRWPLKRRVMRRAGLPQLSSTCVPSP